MILISKEELSVLKNISENELTVEDGEILLENKKTIKKYLNKIITNIQIGIGLGQYRGSDYDPFTKIETVMELINGLDEIEKGFLEYQRKTSQ